jgi:hypothetical protein
MPTSNSSILRTASKLFEDAYEKSLIHLKINELKERLLTIK